MDGHARSPRPRDVPGFQAAAAAGTTPPRPAVPPRLLPGTTAHQALVRCAVVLACAAALIAVAVAAGPASGGQATASEFALMLAATTTGIAAMLAAIGRFRKALLAELAAGYVTTTFHQGLFWFTQGPGPKTGNNVVGWTWTGIWVLTSTGTVTSRPDLQVDPPGFYPSPNQPGQMELWTGAQWIGVHTPDPATRL